LELASEPDERALLMHEIGVLEELHRDDHAAAKDLLGAVNAATSLREPLEHLIALVERRHSFQNLGKLLDRLGRVASEPEEVVRAQLARGDFLSDQRHDDEGARQAYAIAENAGVDRAVVWLSLELLAGKLGDGELAKRVVTARASVTEDPTYKAMLQFRAASAALDADDEAAGLDLLEKLAAATGPAKERALAALERTAEKHGDRAKVAELREARAQLFTQMVEKPDLQADHGLLQPHAAAAIATELWVRAAHERCALQDNDRALANLARAERLLGSNPAVLHAMVDAHAAAGNPVGVTQAVERILQTHDVTGTGKAVLLWRAAEAEAHRGHQNESLLLLRRALEADPKCLPARALQLHELAGTENFETQAEALESIANESPDESTKARFHALAALAWSRSRSNSGAARAALSQASLAGTDPRTAARMARLFSTLSGDPIWQREATERLLKSPEVEERHSAWLELARGAWLRGEDDNARQALSELAKEPGGAWLAAVLLAYQPATPGEPDAEPDLERGAEALLMLASVAEPAVGTGLRQIVAMRRQRTGNVQGAHDLLAELHENHPADVVVATQLGSVLRQLDSAFGAAVVLAETGDATACPEVAVALKIKAGILAWLGGAREQAVESFESAAALNGSAGSGLLQWALRAAQPDAPEARRKALQVALESNGDLDVYALERFALGVGQRSDHPGATEGLDAADEVSLGESGEAVQLARALWVQSSGHQAALRHLAGHSDTGKELTLAVRYLTVRALANPNSEEMLAAAEAWAKTGALPGALEWLAAALACRDLVAELAARRAISEHLSGETKAAHDAGITLLHHIVGKTTPTLLDDPAPQARLADLEVSPPGCDPRRRALALSGASDLLGGDADPVNLALAGYNELLAQHYEAALASFRGVVTSLPEDIFGWEGLRLSAQHLEHRGVEAEASQRLGALSKDPIVAARFYREAAHLLLDDLRDEPAGHAALERATELDISHKGAFKRWYSVLRGRDDAGAMVELLARRIEVSNDANELSGLYWERARAFRDLGELDRALEEIQNLRLLDSNHVGARALSGEIYIRQEAFELAAAELASLARMDSAPEEQRLMSGIAAVDLYETKLGDLSGALGVLDALQAADLETLAVRERLARAAAKAERWEDTARLLEELLGQRETRKGRIDAARLLLAVYRDKLKQPHRAKSACEALLEEAPTDPETLDFVLDGPFTEQQKVSWLERIRNALLDTAAGDLDDEQIARMARVAEQLDDLSLRQASLGALVTLGINTEAIREELSELNDRSASHPQIVIGDLRRAGLLHPGDDGPISRLFQHLGPHLPEVLGPTLKSLGVGRRQRVKTSAGGPMRTELAAFVGAFGIGEFELYVGGSEPNTLIAIPDPKLPAFVLGPNLVSPLEPRQRWSLVQQVMALCRGTTVLLQRDVSDVAALATAACKVGKAPLAGPSFSTLGEYERLLERELPRRVRKELIPIAAEISESGAAPLEWAAAARATLDRAAALAVGDVSWVVLSRKERETQQRSFDGAAEERLWDLLRFVLSTDFIALREKLGMAPR
jgi:hypothetical protein